MFIRNELFSNWVFKLLVLVTHIACETNNYSELIKKRNGLPEDVVNVISHCYLKNETLILSGNWSDVDISTISKLSNSATSLYTIGLTENLHFKKHKRLKNIYQMSLTVIRKKKYPGNVFIVMIYDIDNLAKALTILKKSVLWNHEGAFLIICKNVEGGCQEAHSLLKLVWSYHILSATLLCYDKYNSLQMYTFNPFTDFAPNFWSVSRDSIEDKSSWTMYRRLLDSSSKKSYEVVCRKLFFDKTINLKGYTIKAGAYLHPRFLPYDNTKTGLERFGGISGQISLIVWKHLNATVHVGNYSKSRFFNDNSLPQSFLRDLLKGKIEITLNRNLLRDFWKLQSYPQQIAGFCLVSRKNIPSIKLDDILELLSKLIIIYCVIYFLILGILKYVSKRNYSFAFLESIRIISNLPISFQLINFVGRNLLIKLIFIMMLLRIYFQSYLTSFNVIPSKSSTIDTVDDLLKSNLYIYGPLDYEEHLSDLDIKSRYRFGEYIDCLDRLFNGQQLICLAGCYQSQHNTYETETLHISKEIKSFYLAFSTSEDWPLYSRFNQILRSLSESGLITFMMRSEYRLLMQPQNATTNIYPKRSWTYFRIVWLIWIVGSLTATVIFFIEVYLHKIKTLRIFYFKKSKRSV